MTAEELLENMGGIWVKRWLAHGGGLIANADEGTMQISMRLDWRRKVPPGSPEWKHRDARAFDMWNTGRWRELSELWTVVPGLRAAIIHHVALHGDPWVSGSRAMQEPIDRPAEPH